MIIDAGLMNAVDFEQHEVLGKMINEIQQDEDSDLIVLTGAGRACGNMNWFQTMIDEASIFRGIMTDAKRINKGLLEIEKPTVCRLNGAATGLGAYTAQLYDLIGVEFGSV